MITSLKSPLSAAAAILAGAIVISAALGAFVYHQAHVYSYLTIDVTGSAERVVDSDTVKWSVSLNQFVPPTSQADAGRQLNADREVFLAALLAAGVESSEVSIQPVSLSETYETINYQTGQTALSGYQANQILVIESSKVAVVDAFAQSAAITMAEKEVSLYTSSLEYYYNKLPDLKLELLTDATRNARARGEAILAGGGGKLGPVISADTGVFQITAVNSSDLSDYGSYDTSSPRKKVTAVVHATFKLKE